MPDTGEQTISGNGEYLLSATHLISFVYCYITTPTIEIDYRSSLIPRRQLHAGWIATASGQVGIASSVLGVPDCSVTWADYIDFENRLWWQPSGHPYDDRIQWRLSSGVVAKFLAAW
jgi:hypothetical protein